MFRNTCSAIELAPTRSCSRMTDTSYLGDRRSVIGCRLLVASGQQTGFTILHLTDDRQLTTDHCPPTTASLPAAATANSPAFGSEPIVVPHDQLRLDLIDCVHGHADHDQQ